MSRKRHDIIDMRIDKPEATVSEIAAHVGVSKQYVSMVLLAANLPTRAVGNRLKRLATHRAEYQCWFNMIDRCLNEGHANFAHYGGRGVRVCDRWAESFENFLDDMGPRPSRHHSLDRVDNDGHYEPRNCRWATRREQRLNQRPSKHAIARTSPDIAKRMWERNDLLIQDKLESPEMKGWTYAMARRMFGPSDPSYAAKFSTPRRAIAKVDTPRAKKGTVERWTSKAYAKIRAEHARTWRDPVHANDAAAFAAMPDDVQSDIGSLSSARRIFGRRNPRKPTNAGRPRKDVK